MDLRKEKNIYFEFVLKMRLDLVNRVQLTDQLNANLNSVSSIYSQNEIFSNNRKKCFQLEVNFIMCLLVDNCQTIFVSVGIL